MKDLRDWVDVAFKVVLAVVGVVVGYYFSFQRQQNEDIKLIVDMTTSGDTAKRLMGASIAKAYFTQKRIPEEVYLAVFGYANNSDDPKLREVVNAGAAAVSKEQPAVRQALIKAADSLPIRIYFHIRDAGDKEVAGELGRNIAAAATSTGNSIIVPGVQLIPGSQSESLLKCFKKAECQALGDMLVKVFGDNGVKLRLSDQSATFEKSDSIRPNHFEAWFASGLRDMLGAVRTGTAKTVAPPSAPGR
jgi:hypothetical protein